MSFATSSKTLRSCPFSPPPVFSVRCSQVSPASDRLFRRCWCVYISLGYANRPIFLPWYRWGNNNKNNSPTGKREKEKKNKKRTPKEERSINIIPGDGEGRKDIAGSWGGTDGFFYSSLSLSLSVCLSLPYIYTQRLIASDAPPLFPVWDVRL